MFYWWALEDLSGSTKFSIYITTEPGVQEDLSLLGDTHKTNGVIVWSVECESGFRINVMLIWKRSAFRKVKGPRELQ